MNPITLPEDIKQMIEDKMCKDPTDRSTCSFLCRARCTRMIEKQDESSGQTKYTYDIHFGRMGTCRPSCKSLLKSGDFGFNRFKIGDKILSDGRMDMYEVQHIATTRKFIMEIFRSDLIRIPKLYDKYLSLVDASYHKSSKYLMPILGVCIDQNDNNTTDAESRIGIVMPKFDITLQQYFIGKGYSLTPEEITKIAYSLIHGIMDLHNFGGKDGTVVHRNINMDNIYGFKSHCPDKEYLWTIGNFRSSKFKTHLTTLTGDKGSYKTMAPEQIIKFEADSKSDIWAIGTILYQLITKNRNPTPIHTICNDRVEMHKVKKDLNTHVLGPLVLRMLNVNMDKRPTAEELIRSFEELEKGRIIEINECRCAVPSSFTYISLDL
jgi:serine/threonine protein kinase